MRPRWICLNDMIAHFNGTLRLATVSSFSPHLSMNVPVCVKPTFVWKRSVLYPYHSATLKYLKVGSDSVERGTLEVRDGTDDLPNDLEVGQKSHFLCELPPAIRWFTVPGAGRSGAFEVSTNRLESNVSMYIRRVVPTVSSLSQYSSHPHCWV